MDIICKKCGSKMIHIKPVYLGSNIYSNEFLHCENCDNILMNSEVEKYIKEYKSLYYINDLFNKLIKEI